MKFKNFIYTLKVCGIRWFAWFLPFPFVVVLLQEFGSQEKFNDKYVKAVRLGNSGLWFIYSQQIQDAIRMNYEKSKKLDNKIKRDKLKREYQKEFKEVRR